MDSIRLRDLNRDIEMLMTWGRCHASKHQALYHDTQPHLDRLLIVRQVGCLFQLLDDKCLGDHWIADGHSNDEGCLQNAPKQFTQLTPDSHTIQPCMLGVT